MKSVLCFDMDGTLTESRQRISDKMLDLILNLKNKYNVVILSGGSIDLIYKQIGNFNDIHYFSTSGSEYYFSGKKVYDYKIGWLEKKLIFSALTELILCYGLEPETNYDDMVEDRISQITFSAIGRNASKESKDAYDVDRSLRKKFVDFLKANFEYKNFKNFNINIGGTTSIDITNKKYSKGEALKYLSKKFNIPLSEFIFFGDKLDENGNDASVVGVCDTIQVINPVDLYKKLEVYL